MIVLDTNVVSELMRPDPAPAVVAWVDRQAEATLFLTTISLAEIRFGIAAMPAGGRRATLSATFEEKIRPLFESRVLEFTESASKQYAVLRAEARSAGHAIGTMDALIAAIASEHRFAVATRDTAPFAAAGVDVIDPWAA